MRARRILPLLLVAFAGAVLAAGGTDEDPKKKPKGPPIEQVVIKGETFKLELAADRPSRTKGLGGRAALEEHGGMLFVFPRPRTRSFWMKDCLIDIDVAFLDHRGRIVSHYKMKKEPPRRRYESQLAYERRLRQYSSRRPMQFAVELKAGSNERLGLKVGETIELDLPKLKKLAK